MHQRAAILLIIFLSTAVFVHASTVWNPSANGITPPGEGDWGNAANWSNGLPSTVSDGKAQFNVSDAADCIVSDAQSCVLFVQGDNGPGGVIRVTAGGTLTTGSNWSAVGYNNSAHMIVETGGTVNFMQNAWIGLFAPSVGTLDINGGTVNVSGQFGLGWQSGTGYVNVNAGVLNLNYWDSVNSIKGDSILNIAGGLVTINGDRRAEVNAYSALGRITAFAGTGQIVAEYNVIPGKTSITAVPVESDPPQPDPATFENAPFALGPDRITMTALPGSDLNGPVEYYFDEITGNPGGADSGWITSASYINSGLNANTTYTYTVSMRDAYGNRGTASAALSAATWSSSTATITWNKSTTPGNWGTSTHWTPYNAGSPDGNFRCVFNKAGAGEAVVTGTHVFNQLLQGSNGPGGVIRISAGGSLTATAGWISIGHNNTARLIVEEGGRCSFFGHMWLAMNNGADAVIEVNGGTITGGGDFGMGWHDGAPSPGTATAKIYVNGGSLNLSHWGGTGAIQPGSFIDIKAGSVTLLGDRTPDVAAFVDAGRITAYGGTGKVIYDYNITNPGKTTVRAVEGVDGDVNADGGVNIKDLGILAEDWLTADCDSPANLDPWCFVDLRDFAALAANWLSGIATDWHIVQTVYPTDDIIVAPYDARALGIAADGITDVTDAIQDALILVDNIGGGTLFLPAGNYRVSGNLTVPGRVTLRGDWQQPQPGQPLTGTILQAYAGRGDENASPFIELSGGAGINGITIWYPEQQPDNIQPYPPTVHGGGNTVENVTFVNSYTGFTTYREGTTARPFVRNVYGTPLKAGIEFDCLADIGRIETVHFSPAFWAGSGLPDSPTDGRHEAWIYSNGTGVIVRRIDWSYSCYVTVEGYSIGFALRPSRFDGHYSNGQSYGFNLLDCQTGVYIEASAYAGYQFTRFNIQGARTGVYLADTATETDTFHTCTINAENDAVLSDGSAKVMMMSCDIQHGTVDINGGYLSVINSSFAAAGDNHIELSSDVRGVSILGNLFVGGAQILNGTSYPVYIDHTPLAVDPLPDYNFRKPTAPYHPAKAELFVVTEPPFSAAADGVTDDTAAFRAALAAAGANGGGIVFVPGGNYRLNGSLLIPSGVELKGIFDCPHSPREKGSLLNVCGGRGDADGIPFIQLESGAGIRGLSFHYPEQVYDEDDNDPQTGMYGMVPYPFLIRGLGSDVYVINVAATIPYQLLDLATHKCDRHYVDYIMATALKTGIHVGGGSEDGRIHNCQLNPSAYTHQALYYDSIPFNTSDNIHKILWRDATPYLFGSMAGEVLHENFVFGGAKGVHFVRENGAGPSGYCMGFGVDQCTNALQVDDVGDGGLDMINSQIVTVNAAAGRYLETSASLNDTFRMFSCAGWGTHQYSAAVYGGDVRLQSFHIAPDGEAGVFLVKNSASLQNLGGDLRDRLASGTPFVTSDPAASAAFVGNIINADAAQMPTNAANVVSVGNIRVQ